MEFGIPVRTTYKDISADEYFDGKCLFCASTRLKIRTSRIRQVPDLGSPSEKVIARLDVVTYHCQGCDREFTPEHPLYPPKFEYSRAIIEAALIRYHYQNASGKAIVRDLALVHHVQVSEATVYSWLKEHSPEFLKAKLAEQPEKLPNNIKAITIDGSYVNLGKEIIGKKKDVESFSVTKLEDGRFLLMGWE